MPSVVNRHSRRITSVCSLLRSHLWPYSDASSCLIARRSAAFLLRWIKRVWKRCAACSCRTRWPVQDPSRAWEVCGTGKDNDGWSSIWMARDRPHDSVRCPRVLIYHLHSDVCNRSVHLATWGTSVERWFALVRRSYRPIPISGWERLGMRAMLTTEGSCSCGIIATDRAGASASPIGVTRQGVVYELFFTALPALGFTAADVVKLYLHRGSFETVLADEDREQDSDRWSSYTTYGKARLANTCTMDMESAPRTQKASATDLDASHRVYPPLKLNLCHPRTSRRLDHLIAPPQWARAARAGSLGGQDFLSQSDGTLRCRQGATLYPQERRPEHDGTVRVLYAARIADCRSCPLRIHCQ